MGFRISKELIKRRICSVVMTLALVLNLLVGYTPMEKMSYEEVKAAAKHRLHRTVTLCITVNGPLCRTEKLHTGQDSGKLHDTFKFRVFRCG